ncbi:unnamed protein product, partial [Didymodactylos carnosus]
MKLKIIGAGFGRTGTLSTKYALEQLGYTCYHMLELRKTPTRSIHWLNAAKSKENQEPFDWDVIFENYDSTVDFPACYFWKELLDYYPDAKVILNVRNPEKWYESVQNTLYKASNSLMLHVAMMWDPTFRKMSEMRDKIVWKGIFQNRFHDKSYTIDIFNRHNDAVKRTVPENRLLVFDVKQGWKPLCDFLDAPVPNTPFPRINDTAEYQNRTIKIPMWIYSLFALFVARHFIYGNAEKILISTTQSNNSVVEFDTSAGLKRPGTIKSIQLNFQKAPTAASAKIYFYVIGYNDGHFRLNILAKYAVPADEIRAEVGIQKFVLRSQLNIGIGQFLAVELGADGGSLYKTPGVHCSIKDPNCSVGDVKNFDCHDYVYSSAMSFTIIPFKDVRGERSIIGVQNYDIGSKVSVIGSGPAKAASFTITPFT